MVCHKEIIVPESPLLPRKGVIEHEYTLVLDLDETLIHFFGNGQEDENGSSDVQGLDFLRENEEDYFYMVRPWCNKFLTEMSNYYEVVIYTAAM